MNLLHRTLYTAFFFGLVVRDMSSELKDQSLIMDLGLRVEG